MKISTLIIRSINLFKKQRKRAISIHTSLWGLKRIYLNTMDASIRRAALKNISHRLLSGEVSLQKAEQALPKILCTALLQLWKLDEEVQSIADVSLSKLAETSYNPYILASLCRNPSVNQIAAKNKDTLAEDVSYVLAGIDLPKNPEYEDLKEIARRIRSITKCHTARKRSLIRTNLITNNPVLYFTLEQKLPLALLPNSPESLF